MKLKQIYIAGYGIWSDLDIEQLPGGMTVFYGQNEAGKTTLMQFVRSVLFGFDDPFRCQYLPPVRGGAGGGEIVIQSPAGVYHVSRRAERGEVEGVAQVYHNDERNGRAVSEFSLETLLYGVDESIFSNVFAVGLRELQELAALNNTAASEYLYKLSSGLDRVSLVDVITDVQDRQNAILATDEHREESRLGTLIGRRDELLFEIDELQLQTKRLLKAASEADSALKESHSATERLDELERAGRVVEVAMQVRETWSERERVRADIAALGELPSSDEIEIEQLDSLNHQLSQQEDKMAAIKRQRKLIRRQATQLPLNRSLWTHAADVNALCAHAPWIEGLQRQISRLRADIEADRKSLDSQVTGLSDEVRLSSSSIERLGTRSSAALKGLARQLREERSELQESQQQLQDAQAEVDRHATTVEPAQAENGGSVAASREAAGRLVNRLRKRIELSAKLEKLSAAENDLTRDIEDVVGEQVLTPAKLAVVGLVFISGIVLAGFGALSFWPDNGAVTTSSGAGYLFMFLGATLSLFGFGLKFHWDKAAREELHDCRHQFEMVTQQIARATTERDEIDHQLPAGDVNWEVRLSDAEASLVQLEELVPLEANYLEAVSHLQEREGRHARHVDRLRSLQKDWQETLQAMGLPKELTPRQAREICERSEQVSACQSRLEQHERDLNQRENELAELLHKIDQLLQSVSVESEDDCSVSSRLEQLRAALTLQRRLMAQRKDLATRYGSLRLSYEKYASKHEHTLQVKDKLLGKAETTTEEEFRDLHRRCQMLEAFSEERDQLSGQIAAALGAQILEDQVAIELEGSTADKLEARWERVEHEIDGLRTTQALAHEQRGKHLHEIQRLSEDTRLEEARLELAVIEQNIANEAKKWQVLAVTSQLLAVVRTRYEATRQPETLLEASRFFERLSEGKYRRIWTRLIGQDLLVDTADGRTLTVEQLSRGTREAMYLALRLALVSAFSRRGIQLPMILDDVLVNFDSARARLAAEVFSQFSNAGHQILFFTCHEHIRDLFHAQNVLVRTLPGQSERVKHAPGEHPSLERPTYGEPSNLAAKPARHRGDLREERDEDLQYELSAIQRDRIAGQKLQQQMQELKPPPDPGVIGPAWLVLPSERQ